MAMVAAMLIWGISWPSAKITGRYADPELIMVWRFIFAAATMTSIMFFMGIKSQFPKKSLSYVIIAAILLVGYNYNYFKGTQIGMASLGGIIVPTMSPLVTYIFVFKIFGKTIHRKEVAGIILGMIGGLILLRFWEINIQSLLDSGNIFFIMAAVIWAGVTIATQKATTELQVLNFSLWLYLFALIFSIPLVPLKSLLTVFQFDWIYWTNFLIISVGSLGFGTTIFFLATMKLGSEKASSFMYVVPTSAMGISAIVLGEQILWSTLIGGILAVTAVYLINRK